MLKIPIYTQSVTSAETLKVQELSKHWNFENRAPTPTDSFALLLKNNILQLTKCDDPKFGSVFVDFSSTKIQHRIKYGGGPSEAIAKAVGIKKGALPNILDLTAGLGRDAFILASLGCRVHMIERNPIVAVLLEDGLLRAQLDLELGAWIKDRLTLAFQDSRKNFEELPFSPDVVYIDPMFPTKKKSALVKKEMQLLQMIIGSDDDADDLFAIGNSLAKNRVVVKRPLLAEPIANSQPDTSIKTKNYRFDMYLKT